MKPILVIFALHSIPLIAAALPPEARQWAAACKTPPPLRCTEAVSRLITGDIQP